MIKPVYTTTYINKNINNICFFAEYIGCLYAILFIYCAAESNFSFFLMPTIRASGPLCNEYTKI